MALEKLKIKANGKEFSAMVNPEKFTVKDSIEYSETNEQRGPKFNQYGGTKFNVPKIFLDTTGVIPTAQWPIPNGTIDAMIQLLKSIVYDFDGSSHEPPIVEVIWGSNQFTGRLLTMDVTYTLFDSEGGPLRAEIELEFISYQTMNEIEAAANKSSPDLTHIIEVKAGDTLPNLCNKVYKDSSYYMQVARINGLSSFCYLKPGTRLMFPPLVD